MASVAFLADTGISLEIYREFSGGVGFDAAVLKGFAKDFIDLQAFDFQSVVDNYRLDVQQLNGKWSSLDYLDTVLPTVYASFPQVTNNLGYLQPVVSEQTFRGLLAYCGWVIVRYCPGSEVVGCKLSEVYSDTPYAELRPNCYCPVVADAAGGRHLFWGVIASKLLGDFSHSLRLQLQVLIARIQRAA